MSDKNKGVPAFPEVRKTGAVGPSGKARLQRISGMTLRDYFAAGFAEQIYAATTVVVTLPESSVLPGGHHSILQPAEQTARDAYALADAMLAERAK